MNGVKKVQILDGTTLKIIAMGSEGGRQCQDLRKTERISVSSLIRRWARE